MYLLADCGGIADCNDGDYAQAGQRTVDSGNRMRIGYLLFWRLELFYGRFNNVV